jgi:alpha-2-macroglobulin
VLLDARAAGVPVSDSVLARLGAYLTTSLAQPRALLTPVARWYTDPTVALSDRVMAVEYLSRAGLRDRAMENEILRVAPQLAWEDRVKLAHVFARSRDLGTARQLLASAWAEVKVEGRRATLPAPTTRRAFYFESRVRPAAYLLSATLAVEPTHPLVGPIVETLVQQTRAQAMNPWNTQDYATAAVALADYARLQKATVGRSIAVRSGARVVARRVVGAMARDTALALTGLLSPGAGGAQRLQLTLDARGAAARQDAAGSPLYYYLTVTEVPGTPTVRPEDRGIRVERWYESYQTGKPVTSIREGELVRVRLRLSVPSERAFVVLDDALPAGLDAVDLSLRTAGGLAGPGAPDTAATDDESGNPDERAPHWAYGSWDGGWWTPFDHRELRDDRVVYFATVLWKGSYTASYVARASTPGVFVRPPAHAEEMYNPGVFGESDGGLFTVTVK